MKATTVARHGRERTGAARGHEGIAIAEGEQSHDDRHHERVGREQRAEAQAVDNGPADEGSEERTDRIGAIHQAEREAYTRGRCSLGECGEHEAGISQAERLETARDREDPHVRSDRRQRECNECRDEGPDDERLSSVAIGERAPERKEGQTNDG